MKFADFKKGKKYQKTKKLESGGGRPSHSHTYTYLVVDKNQDTEEIFASIVPEVGEEGTAPFWYRKAEYCRWKPVPKN